MRFALILFLSLFPVITYAEVQAGDQAVYDLTGYNFGTQTASLTRIVTAVDPANDKIYFQDILFFNGQTTMNEETSLISVQNSYDQSTTSESECTRLVSSHESGKWVTTSYEQQTVLGQTLNTCHAHIVMTGADGAITTEDAWIGMVPFGSVKVLMSGAEATFGSMTLTSFTKN